MKKLKTSKLYYNLCLIIFLSLLTACNEETPKLSPLSKSSTILAFGDSLTFGTGASKSNSYPSVLRKLSGIRVINDGIPGEISANGLIRLKEVLSQQSVDLVILCHGGNDLIQRLDIAETSENLRAMIKMIRANNAEVVLIGVPKPGIFLKPVAFYRQISTDMHLPFLENTLSEILSDGSLKADTVHPNAKGYTKLAEAIYQLLLETKALPAR